MIQNTSISAYKAILNHLGQRQRQILKVLLERGAMTDMQIANLLNWPINCVTPRRGELVKIGVVEIAYEGRNLKGRKAKVWGVKMSLLNEYQNQKKLEDQNV